MSVFALELKYYVGDREDNAVFRRLRLAFERAAADLAKPGRFLFPRLMELMETEIRGQFRAKGRGPTAGAWQPLSPAYAEWKRKHYPGKPTLVRTGALKEGLTDSASPFAERSFSDVMMNFGTSGVPYASFHQLGASARSSGSRIAKAVKRFFSPHADFGRAGGGLPARPPIDFRNEFDKKVQAAAVRAFRDSIKAARNDDLLQLEGDE